MVRNSSFSEKPERQGPRRLADWINPAGAKKVHSLVDKVYKTKNLYLAWESVKANRGAGGIDGVTLKSFEEKLDENLKRLYEQLRVRQLTKRRVPLSTEDLIGELNPLLRGWGHYYCKSHVRRLFNRLDRWIVHRIWSHRYRRWRNGGWRALPERCLYGRMGLVNLISLIPSLAS